jgi:endonuclease/exonuclease/phosphatase family metal-dependent hydrolase
VAEYDANALREAEASFLRRHVRGILSRDPSTRLVVMGDFNDTKNSHALREITGKPDWPDSLRALPLTDARGENWTEFWEDADVYSRIDYVMVSKKLESDVDSTRSAVARLPFWREASDHCPLVLTLNKNRTEPALRATPPPQP